MTRVFQLAGLRALLAAIVAVAGLSGLMATATAQEVVNVSIEAGSSGVGVLPDGTELRMLNADGDVMTGASVGGQSLPLEGVPLDLTGLADGEYSVILAGVDASSASFTVAEGVASPGALTLTLAGGEEPPVLEGPVWTSIYVALPDGAADTIGMAWALDNAATGERIAEGSDYVELPQWLINAELDLGTYNLSLDPRPNYAPIQTQIVIDASTAQYLESEGYWYAQFEFTLEPAEAPVDLALVYLDVSSADPAVANTLPAGATWVISDNSGAGHGVISSGEFTDLDLPVTVEVPEGVPYGEMLISIDGLPAFEAYEWTHEIVDDVEYLDIVLQPVAGDDNGDNGDGDGDNGDKDNGKDNDGDTKDKDKGKDKKDGDKAEDVKSLPVVGSGPSDSAGAGVYSVLALIAAIVAAGAGLRLRGTSIS